MLWWNAGMTVVELNVQDSFVHIAQLLMEPRYVILSDIFGVYYNVDVESPAGFTKLTTDTCESPSFGLTLPVIVRFPNTSTLPRTISLLGFVCVQLLAEHISVIFTIFSNSLYICIHVQYLKYSVTMCVMSVALYIILIEWQEPVLFVDQSVQANTECIKAQY